MSRSLLAIAVGYFTVAALNGFSRIIISLYFRTDISLAGIQNLPSQYWVYALTALQFIFGLFGGLMVSSIVKTKAYIEILSLILLMIAIGFIDYSMLNEREPLWYLITSPLLKILGIFAGYQLKLKQDEQLNQSVR